jgi:glutaminase
MEELGAHQVFQKIGSEPTGRAVNSPLAVDMATHTGNPLMNGAYYAAEVFENILSIPTAVGQIVTRCARKSTQAQLRTAL